MFHPPRLLAFGILLALFLVPAFLALDWGGPGEPRKTDLVRLPQRLTVSGELAERVRLTVRRLLSDNPYSDSLILEDVARRPDYDRRFEEYEGDVSGRYLGALSAIGSLLGQRLPKLERVAQQILQHQSSDGFFGIDQEPQGWEEWRKQLWGHGRLLTGLIEYYRYSGDERFLTAAKGLARYLAAGIDRWPLDKTRHRWFTDFTSLLESFMILWEVDRSEDWLKAARKVAPLVPEFGRYHAHGYLISRVGVTKLALATGDTDIVAALAEEIRGTLLPKVVLPDGGMVEWLPSNNRTEGCAVVDWLRLLLGMWELTGSGHYIEQAERTWLNSLYFHQTANGAFGHAHVTAVGYEAPYSEAWWCCLPHGLYGYVEILRHAVAVRRSVLYVNFYVPLRWSVDLSGRTVNVEVDTDYPRSGLVLIRLDSPRRLPLTLKVRIPAWCDSPRVEVNGEEIQVLVSEGYATLTREWPPGSVLRLTLPLQLRRETSTPPPSIAPNDSGRYTFFYHGPLLLVQWGRETVPYPTAPSAFAPAAVPEEPSPSPFSIPSAHYRLRPGAAAIVLTPISEATAFGHWTAELQNFIPTGEKPIQRRPARWCWPIAD